MPQSATRAQAPKPFPWEAIAIIGVAMSILLALWVGLERHRLGEEMAMTQQSISDIEGRVYNLRQARQRQVESLEAEVKAAKAIEWYPPGIGGGTIEIDLNQRQLRLTKNGTTLFEAPVAVGKGWRWVGGKAKNFSTPTGERRIEAKEESPVWVPPDWHYQELAQHKGLDVRRLTNGSPLTLPDGSTLAAEGGQVRLTDPSGGSKTLPLGKDIIVAGTVVIPPLGNGSRSKAGPLGTRRLKLGDSYAIHGTNNDRSIGTASSHGCIRMSNEDIEALYPLVEVGTKVIIR